MGPPDPPSAPRWPRRSRHFLRIGKARFVPLLLFVLPSHFNQAIFDIILSVLYDKLPQEMVLDPQQGFQIISSPFHAQRPYYFSNDGVHFYYYWTPTPASFSIVAPKAKVDTEALTSGISSDSLSPTNMTLILCVLSCPAPNNQKTSPNIQQDDTYGLDHGTIAINGQTNVAQYFTKESASNSHKLSSTTSESLSNG